MYCKKCGAELPEGSLFCSKCGTSIGSNEGVVNNSKVEAIRVVPNTANPESQKIKPKKPLSKKTKIWIIVGAAILVVAIVLVIVFTTTGNHKNGGNSVGDGRYADGKKAYRYSDNWSGDSTLMIDKLTITPTDDGLLAEFYLENNDQENILWGWGTQGRMTLETYDGETYTGVFDSSISSSLLNAGEKSAYRVFFRNARGIPKTLTFHDLYYVNSFESYGDFPLYLPEVNLS